MNLIEQLGGYEKAKEFSTWADSVRWNGHNQQKLDELRKEILQYRREHGIFEVGDWVGIKDDSIKWVKKIVSIESKTAYDSQWNAQQLEILVFEDGAKLGSGWAIHATDEEIKAGHRL